MKYKLHYADYNEVLEKFTNNPSYNITVSPDIKPNIIKNNVQHVYYIFNDVNTNYTFNPSIDVPCEILIVGGGGGGNAQGGGGGGGSVIHLQNASLKANTTYNIKIGNGGPQNTNGEDTNAFGFIAKGGGAGGDLSDIYENKLYTGNNGGSGGGGSRFNYRDKTLDSTTVKNGGKSIKNDNVLNTALINQNTVLKVYGNDGGEGGTQDNRGKGGSGGGGGAGEKGQDGRHNSNGGKGGDGVLINIIGKNYYWGAGGGGSCCCTGKNSTAGNGGKGGAGAGAGYGILNSGKVSPGNSQANIDIDSFNYPGFASSLNGSHAGENTGSGGGGGETSTRGQPGKGGSGGSGVVIIKVPVIVDNIQLNNLPQLSDKTPVIIYLKEYLKGNEFPLKEGFYRKSDLINFNDKINSIEIDDGYKVILYEDDNFQGKYITLLYTDESLRKSFGFNDKISSIKVIPLLPDEFGVIIYTDTNYKGIKKNLNVGSHNKSSLGKNFENKISSIKVFSGYKAILYEDDDFKGISITYTTNITTLSRDGLNNKVLSIKVINIAEEEKAAKKAADIQVLSYKNMIETKINEVKSKLNELSNNQSLSETINVINNGDKLISDAIKQADEIQKIFNNYKNDNELANIMQNTKNLIVNTDNKLREIEINELNKELNNIEKETSTIYTNINNIQTIAIKAKETALNIGNKIMEQILDNINIINQNIDIIKNNKNNIDQVNINNNLLTAKTNIINAKNNVNKIQNISDTKKAYLNIQTNLNNIKEYEKIIVAANKNIIDNLSIVRQKVAFKSSEDLRQSHIKSVQLSIEDIIEKNKNIKETQKNIDIIVNNIKDIKKTAEVIGNGVITADNILKTLPTDISSAETEQKNANKYLSESIIELNKANKAFDNAKKSINPESASFEVTNVKDILDKIKTILSNISISFQKIKDINTSIENKLNEIRRFANEQAIRIRNENNAKIRAANEETAKLATQAKLNANDAMKYADKYLADATLALNNATLSKDNSVLYSSLQAAAGVKKDLTIKFYNDALYFFKKTKKAIDDAKDAQKLTNASEQKVNEVKLLYNKQDTISETENTKKEAQKVINNIEIAAIEVINTQKAADNAKKTEEEALVIKNNNDKYIDDAKKITSSSQTLVNEANEQLEIAKGKIENAKKAATEAEIAKTYALSYVLSQTGIITDAQKNQAIINAE